MLALRRASACLALGVLCTSALANAQPLPRSSPAPAAAPAPSRAGPAAAPAPSRPPAAAPPTSPAAGHSSALASALASASASASAPASASAAPAETPPPSLPPPSPTGSLGGILLLARGGVPKHGVVYLDGVPAGSFTVPKDRVSLSSRAARFYPEFLVIPVGQSVTIANNDRLIHSPFSLSAPKTFEFEHEASGETRSLSFERPGVVDVFCNIHQTMQAMIVVVPSTYYALLAPDGSFQLSGVPVGHYRLIGYSPEVLKTEQASLSVDIRPHERTTVKLQFGQAVSAVSTEEKPR